MNAGAGSGFPMQMDDPRVRADARLKVERLRSWLERENLDGVILSRRDNFAWLTVGGDNHVLNNTEVGVGAVLITPERQVLFAYTMDGDRLLEEEMPGQGYELVKVRWYEDEPRLQALALAGKHAAADTSLPGARDCSIELSRMHEPLTELELSRYRWLAHRTGLTLEEIAPKLEPGMTEQIVARRIISAFLDQGIEIDVLLVGSDERMRRIRHAVPSNKQIERFVLFNPTARRWGLHANVSRCVCFGAPDESLRKANEAVLGIEAKIFAGLAPGAAFAEILERQKSWYKGAGYSEEWRNHFQGGTTGYVISDASLCLTDEVVKDNQAFDWFVTVPGVMAEELALLAGGKLEVASAGENWPLARISLGDREICLPGLWIA